MHVRTVHGGSKGLGAELLELHQGTPFICAMYQVPELIIDITPRIATQSETTERPNGRSHPECQKQPTAGLSRETISYNSPAELQGYMFASAFLEVTSSSCE